MDQMVNSKGVLSKTKPKRFCGGLLCRAEENTEVSLLENLALVFFSQICRLQRHLSAGEHQQDLFQNQPPMFVSQHSQPPTQNLVELIQLCGGTVCKSVRQAGICIGKYNGRRPEGSRVLSEQWVLGKI